MFEAHVYDEDTFRKEWKEQHTVTNAGENHE